MCSINLMTIDEMWRDKPAIFKAAAKFPGLLAAQHTFQHCGQWCRLHLLGGSITSHN